MTLSHIGIYVADVDRMCKFYLAALKPLGYKKQMEPAKDVIGMGAGMWGPPFWLAPADTSKHGSGEKLHIAFHAANRQVVRDFHTAALKAGATCNGPPGIRKQYMSTYYAAFVLDPEGRNIEAHCVTPAFISEPSQRKMVLAGLLVAFIAAAALWGRSRSLW